MVHICYFPIIKFIVYASIQFFFYEPATNITYLKDCQRDIQILPIMITYKFCEKKILICNFGEMKLMFLSHKIHIQARDKQY